MEMNYIIIEDEPLAMERVMEFAGRCPWLRRIGAFENAMDAIQFLKSNPAHLIFLDINIGGINGIQFLEMEKPDAEVIIITAYHDHALKGFELKVTDYLLKPFSFERFLQATERAQLNYSRAMPVNDRSFLFIKTEYRLEKVFLSEIVYIEGMRDYRKIHTLQKTILTLQTFRELEKDLPSDKICRVHRSYMVALDKIDLVEQNFIKIQNRLIPVSSTYKKLFYDQVRL
jgi:two-component system, LytTR family, response regulator